MSTETKYVQTKIDNIFHVLRNNDDNVCETKTQPTKKYTKEENEWEKYYNEYINSDFYIKKGTKWGDVE